MAVTGVNFGTGENIPEQGKINTIPKFINTVFPINECSGGEPVEASTNTSKTAKTASTKYVPSEKTVKAIADSWAAKWKISNKNGEFTKFVRKLYDVASALNVTKLNGERDNRFPHKEDQIVDEIMGIFANESQFNTKSTSKDNLFHGIFQFSAVGMQECEDKEYLKKAGLKKLSMTEFKQLSGTRQLDYMVEYVKICKKYYSKIGDNEAIAPKQLYAMINYPKAGKPNTKFNAGTKKKPKIKDSNIIIEQKADTIATKQKERGGIKIV